MFAFFTTLYAISVVDAEKAERLVHSIKESFGEGAFDIAKLSVLEHALGTAIDLEELTPPQTPIQSAAERIQNLTLPKNIRESMTVRETERGLVITLAETLLFESGGTALSSDSGRRAHGQPAALWRPPPDQLAPVRSARGGGPARDREGGGARAPALHRGIRRSAATRLQPNRRRAEDEPTGGPRRDPREGALGRLTSNARPVDDVCRFRSRVLT
jgi:hypothetical protein